MSGVDFLLEIGTEEFPAKFVPRGMVDLERIAKKYFSDQAIEHGSIKTYGTPRRLALLVQDVARVQADRTREVTGPPKNAAFDNDGQPTKAAKGFAKGQGVAVESLQTRQTEKGEYVVAVIEEIGKPVAGIMPSVAAELVGSLTFQKSMRWGSGSFRFARPMHWILALFDGKPVPFEVAGLKSGDLSYGHRFLAPDAFRVSNVNSYFADLEERFVVADPGLRKQRISTQCEELAKSVNGLIVQDEELLGTVANIVEFPFAVMGRFENKYLLLPKGLLITVMKGHQKYFSLQNRHRELLPRFITISNSRPEIAETVIAGNERVLRARLEDARFYYDDDRKYSLRSRVDALKAVTYQEKLGTVYQKVERFTNIALSIADSVDSKLKDDLKLVCRLSKADLTTGIVYEFPELQGYMGMIYALNDGEKDSVAQAVKEHYKPRFSGDKPPEGDLGAIVALADKIDSIVAFFSVGMIPTGSEDPFALRRQALGLLAILEKKKYGISIEDLIDMSIQALPASQRVDESLAKSVLTFIKQRLEGLLEAEGVRYDEIDAILSTGVGQVNDLRARLKALMILRKDDRRFSDLVLAAKRVYNILAKAPEISLNESLLKEDAESALHKTVLSLSDRVNSANSECLNEIVGPINTFFDTVLVMDKEEDVKFNRLALLQSVKNIFERIGDFSKIVVVGGKPLD